MNPSCLPLVPTIDKYYYEKLDLISEELFKKIRGRFPTVTIGNAEGIVTNKPK